MSDSESGPTAVQLGDLRNILTQVKQGVSQVRESVQGWKEMHNSTPALTYPQGISLLSLKNHLLLSYLHHMTAIFALKLDARSLTAPEGSAVVANLVKLRVVLEKVNPLETKLKYQIDKLVRKADQAAEGGDEEEVVNDPLAFRPNPSALVLDGRSDSGNDSDEDASAPGGGFYRPPRLAAMPFNEVGLHKGKKAPKKNLPSHMLSDLSHTLSGSTPYGESTSGLSTAIDASLTSGTARHLKEVDRYETDNFTRLKMSKKDAKRRRAEEEEVAFGGLGAGKGGKRRLGGFGAELDDLLGEMKNSRAENAYAQMGKMKKAKTGTVEKDEGAGSSGLAGLAGGKKRGSNTFDRAVRKEGKKGAKR